MMDGTSEHWHKSASPKRHLGLLNKRATALWGRSPDPQTAAGRGIETPPFLGMGWGGTSWSWPEPFWPHLLTAFSQQTDREQLYAGPLGQTTQTEGLKNMSMVTPWCHWVPGSDPHPLLPPELQMLLWEWDGQCRQSP